MYVILFLDVALNFVVTDDPKILGKDKPLIE